MNKWNWHDRNEYIWAIDQVWGKDGWILAKSFFCENMDRDGVEVHKLAKKKKPRPISSHNKGIPTFLTRVFLSIWISSLNFWNFGLNGLYFGNFTNSLFPRNSSNFSRKFCAERDFFFFLFFFFLSVSHYSPHPENHLRTLSCDVSEATSQFQDGADTGWKRSIERTRCSCDKRLYFTAKIKSVVLSPF